MDKRNDKSLMARLCIRVKKVSSAEKCLDMWDYAYASAAECNVFSLWQCARDFGAVVNIGVTSVINFLLNDIWTFGRTRLLAAAKLRSQ